MISSEVKVGIVMDWTKRLGRWFPVVAAFFLFATCSGDGPADDELPSGVTEGSPSLGIAPPTGTSTPSTPPVAAACPNEASVATDLALQVGTAVTGDVDGDGTSDRVHVAIDHGGGAGCSAFVVVKRATGESVAAPVWEIGAQGGLPSPRLHALRDIDGSAGAEVVVDEAAGASTQFVGAFTFIDDELERVTVPGSITAGAPAGAADLFPYGGSVGHVGAVDCVATGTVVVSTATPSSEPSEAEQGIYEVERVFYTFDGAALKRDDDETHRISIDRLSRFPEFGSGPFASC